MPILRIKVVLLGFFLFFAFSLPTLEANPRRGAATTRVQLRTLNEIFPGLTREQRLSVFSFDGLKNTFTRHEAPLIIPSANSGIDLLSAAM